MNVAQRQPKAPAGFAPHGLRGGGGRLPKLAPAHFLFVADESNHRITLTFFHGEFWRPLGSSGSGDEQLSSPKCVHYDPTTKTFYATDSGNDRIVKWKTDGSGWASFGSSGAGANQFNTPWGIYADPAGDYLYVCDCFNHRLVRISMSDFDGTGWTAMGANGNGAYQFDEPACIDVDPSTGHVYVADFGNHRIVETNMAGTYWDQVCAVDGLGNPQAGAGNYEFNQPRGVHYDAASGYVYACDEGNDRVSKFTMAETGWTEISGVGSDTFADPYGVFYDGQTDTVLVADRNNNRLIRAKMDGTQWDVCGSVGGGDFQFQTPTDVHLDRRDA